MLLSWRSQKRYHYLEEEFCNKEAANFLLIPSDARKLEFIVPAPWHWFYLRSKPFLYAAVDLDGIKIGDYSIAWPEYRSSWIANDGFFFPYQARDDILHITTHQSINDKGKYTRAICIKDKSDNSLRHLAFRIPSLNFSPDSFVVMTQVIHRAYDMSRSS